MQKNTIELRPIGQVQAGEAGFALQLAPGYATALAGLEGFSHVTVLWWAHGCADETHRRTLAVPKPYRAAPDTLGVFATRSPARPNPIGLSVAAVTGINATQGILYLAWIDADPGTPVLDIKPYTPSVDRVENHAVPAWCAHWPNSLEASESFDWEGEFLFKADA